MPSIIFFRLEFPYISRRLRNLEVFMELILSQWVHSNFSDDTCPQQISFYSITNNVIVLLELYFWKWNEMKWNEISCFCEMSFRWRRCRWNTSFVKQKKKDFDWKHARPDCIWNILSNTESSMRFDKGFLREKKNWEKRAWERHDMYHISSIHFPYNNQRSVTLIKIQHIFEWKYERFFLSFIGAQMQITYQIDK